MGAHPYFYFVKYQDDAHKALQELRKREFAAGRYNPVMPFLDFPLGPNSPVPGARHDSIDKIAGQPADNPVHVRDLFATVYHALGFTRDTKVFDLMGRPHFSIEGNVVERLL